MRAIIPKYEFWQKLNRTKWSKTLQRCQRVCRAWTSLLFVCHTAVSLAFLWATKRSGTKAYGKRMSPYLNNYHVLPHDITAGFFSPSGQYKHCISNMVRHHKFIFFFFPTALKNSSYASSTKGGPKPSCTLSYILKMRGRHLKMSTDSKMSIIISGLSETGCIQTYIMFNVANKIRSFTINI